MKALCVTIVTLLTLVAYIQICAYAAECAGYVPGDSIIYSGYNVRTGQVGLPIYVTTEGDERWSPPGYPECVYKLRGEYKLAEHMCIIEKFPYQKATTYSEYIQHEILETITSENVRNGTFSDLSTYDAKFAREILNDDIHELDESRKEWQLYSLAGLPLFVLRQQAYFEKALNILPTSIQTEEDSKKYCEFLEAFGTDIVTRATFGFRYRDYTGTTQKFINDYTRDLFNVQERYQFIDNGWNIISNHMGFIRRENIPIDYKVYRKNTRSMQAYYGGQFLGNDTQWMQTGSMHCAPLNLTLIELASVMGPRKDVYRKFVNDYVRKGC